MAAGSDPDQLLREALAGALAATGGSGACVLSVAGGTCRTIATAGQASEAALPAGRAAVDGARSVRRRDGETGAAALAEPLRAGHRIVGALVVTGAPDRLDATRLALFASATAGVVQRHDAATPEALPELLASLGSVARDLDPSAMSARILESARDLFGVDSSLCSLASGDAVRVSTFRGIDAERLARATRQPGFRALLTGRDLQVVRADNPVVACLTDLDQVAVSLPLAAGGRILGRVVLLLAEAPSPSGRALLERFASQAAVCLLAAQLHREVNDQEHQLASVAHSVGQPVVMVDDSGLLVEVNGAAAQTFHLADGFERGQPVEGRLGHPTLEKMLTSGREVSAEVVVGTGDPRVYRASVRRVRGADGRVRGRVMVLDDVTTARQTDALKADFVAVIGHELRTPITVMKGYLTTLVRHGDSMSDARRGQAIKAVDASLGRLERLIEDLLFVSAIEERTPQLDLRPVDLAELLRAEERDRVRIETPAGGLVAEIDEARLGQVVRHLLDNALQHSTGPVTVRLEESGGTAEVSVVDSGPGIFSGDLPHLFERFRQLDGSSTRSHGGLGIGLYICRRIVEAMGGRIWCESRLGVGSRFVFSLPSMVARAEPAEAEAS